MLYIMIFIYTSNHSFKKFSSIYKLIITKDYRPLFYYFTKLTKSYLMVLIIHSRLKENLSSYRNVT